MGELEFNRILKKGDRGKKVRAVQEWVSLRGIGLVTDGQFGSATEFAIRAFQREHGLDANGMVDRSTFNEIITPLRNVVTDQIAAPTLGEAVVAYAKQHLEQGPREVGGQNRGPWVRFYMKGNEGDSWPWCAGFVCYVVKQACQSLGLSMPIQASFSCDSLAASAKEKGRFLSEHTLDRIAISPGMLFLNRRTSTDWTHVGIVLDASNVDEEVFLTIEGNTNDSGDREGYEVCRRVRNFRQKDFIRID